jgi:hypothetical protein
MKITMINKHAVITLFPCIPFTFGIHYNPSDKETKA